MIAPESVYPKPTESIIEVFDVRILRTAGRFHSERAAWKDCGEVEALDKDHYVLIVRPGGARRIEA